MSPICADTPKRAFFCLFKVTHSRDVYYIIIFPSGQWPTIYIHTHTCNFATGLTNFRRVHNGNGYACIPIYIEIINATKISVAVESRCIDIHAQLSFSQRIFLIIRVLHQVGCMGVT